MRLAIIIGINSHWGSQIAIIGIQKNPDSLESGYFIELNSG